MITSRIIPILAAVCIYSTGFGNWLLVDNFENGLDQWVRTDPLQDCVDPSDGACDGVRLVIDDFGLPGNMIGSFQAAAEGQTANFISVNAVPLPQFITADQEALTLYVRFAIASFRMDVNFGLVGPEASGVEAVYGAFESQVRVTVSNGGILDVRDFDRFTPVTTSPLEDMTWYEVWMVHDNQDLSWDLYIRGGEFSEQTLLKEGILYRASLGEMRAFAIFMGTGSTENPNGNSAFFIDDIYLDPTGANLSSPLANGQAMWGDFVIGATGWVDTGTFLGMIYPVGDWVYSALLDNWMFLPAATVAEDGAWGFILRP